MVEPAEDKANINKWTSLIKDSAEDSHNKVKGKDAVEDKTGAAKWAAAITDGKEDSNGIQKGKDGVEDKNNNAHWKDFLEDGQPVFKHEQVEAQIKAAKSHKVAVKGHKVVAKGHKTAASHGADAAVDATIAKEAAEDALGSTSNGKDGAEDKVSTANLLGAHQKAAAAHHNHTGAAPPHHAVVHHHVAGHPVKIAAAPHGLNGANNVGEDGFTTKRWGGRISDAAEDAQGKGGIFDGLEDRVASRRWNAGAKDVAEDAKGFGPEDKRITSTWTDVTEDSHGKLQDHTVASAGVAAEAQVHAHHGFRFGFHPLGGLFHHAQRHIL